MYLLVKNKEFNLKQAFVTSNSNSDLLEKHYLGYSKSQLTPQKGFNTAKEIENQPAVWQQTFDYLKKHQPCQNFLKQIASVKGLEIVLTGAGSSAFIGDTVQHAFLSNLGNKVSSLPTTSLTTHFKNYIDCTKPLLLVSFARSGNSPESLAVVDIAELENGEVYHLAITCNADGKLAEKVDELQNGCSIVLPPETEDNALAMTGSFTSMTLAGILSKNLNNLLDCQSDVKKMCQIGYSLINNYHDVCKDIASLPYNRIVFLGSGPLLGIATESHLKVQELTDGEVVGKYDSFLGFRHGPKVIAREDTLLVYLFSSNVDVFRYEKDLADEIEQQNMPAQTIGVFSNNEQAEQVPVDYSIIFDQPENLINPDLLIPNYVIPAQMIGFFTSRKLGLNPDEPSRAGAITRVVKPFKIFTKGEAKSIPQ